MTGSTGMCTLSLQLLDDGSAVERVANALRRRGYVLQFVQYGPTDHPGVSRMTLTVHASRCGPERIGPELKKLYCVLDVSTCANEDVGAESLSIKA